jgi:hypothetical protein
MDLPEQGARPLWLHSREGAIASIQIQRLDRMNRPGLENSRARGAPGLNDMIDR